MESKKIKGLMLTFLLAATLGLAVSFVEAPSVSACFNNLFVEAFGSNEFDFAYSMVDVTTSFGFHGAVVVGPHYRYVGGTPPYDFDGQIAVIDANGRFVSGLRHGWPSPFNGLEGCYDIVRDPNNPDAVVVVGTTSVFRLPVPDRADLFIARFGLSGTPTTAYLWPTWMTVRNGLVVGDDGSLGFAVDIDGTLWDGYIVAGAIWNFPAGTGMNAIVAKFDWNGIFKWAIVLVGPGDEFAADVIVAVCHIYITGWTNSFGSMDTLIASFTDLGTSVRLDWAYAYDGGLNEAGNCVSIDPFCTYLYVTGWTTSVGFGGRDFFLATFNLDTGIPDGPFMFPSVYGGTKDDEASSMIMSDGTTPSYVITGSTKTASGDSDAILVKLEYGGTPLWSWRTGGSADDGGFKVIDCAPGFAVAGFTYSYGCGPEDVYLATFDQNGITAAYPDCQKNYTFSWRILEHWPHYNITETQPAYNFTYIPEPIRYWDNVNLTVSRICYPPQPQPWDLMVGCIELNGSYTVIGYRGTGTTSAPSWERMANWDIPNVPGDAPRASPCFADLDWDGDYDLLISNARYNYPPMGYKNIGNATNPVWQRCPEWDAPNLGGYEQNPALVDLDDDGDYDLCVAGTYIEGHPHYVAFFENTGDKSHPVWTRKPEWDISSPGVTWPSPAFADLDNDGDYDLMLGSYTESYLAAWENIGGKTNPVWARKPEWDLTGLQPNDHKRPCFADLDSDGDYDLLDGDSQLKNITAYENTGKPTNPVWTRKPEWDIKTPEMANMIWIRPAFANLDEGIHNIAVTNAVASKTVVGQGYTIYINVTLTNKGSYPELVDTRSWVIYPDQEPEPAPWGDVNVTLAPRETKTITFTWNTAGFAKGNYTIIVCVWLPKIPFEPDLGDNTFINGIIYVGIPGDIAEPFGVVDGKDIALVCRNFGKPAWYKPNTDINNDGIVDGKDIAITCRNFGKTDP